MDDYWDFELFQLDHVTMNLFVSEVPTSFADEKLVYGDNITLEIGEQFTLLSELRLLARDIPISTGTHDWLQGPTLDAVSLVVPDRTNWPRLPSLLSTDEIRLHRARLRIAVEDPTDGALEIIYDSDEEQ